jgi:hypothetical protein
VPTTTTTATTTTTTNQLTSRHYPPIKRPHILTSIHILSPYMFLTHQISFLKRSSPSEADSFSAGPEISRIL